MLCSVGIPFTSGGFPKIVTNHAKPPVLPVKRFDANEIKMFLLTFYLFLCLICVNAQQGQETDTPEFAPEEKFLDILPITQENFTDVVLNCNDPWIIIFHDGTMSMGWKKMAVGTRGVVWLGMIDKTLNPELLSDINYNPAKDGESRVYPYGGTQHKKKKWVSAKNPNDAKIAAIKSLPDQTLRMKGKDIQDFLVECFSSSPSRFPIVLLTDTPDTPSLFKALAIRFRKYYNFGRFVDATIEDFRSLGLGLEDDTFELPAILVLVPQRPGMIEEIAFNAVEYRTNIMGVINYSNVLQFLFAVNNKYRYWLPGSNMSNRREVAEMEDIIEIENRRFDILFEGKKAKITKKKDENQEEQIMFAKEQHEKIQKMSKEEL
ncbi:uncharacterized protein LOC110466596 [Mizuhopecten yessoensis]|uniref:Uncharacterized protein n=1 Tax=Mizuhopecten yessoensis TaxID=6573 RepID=A0A210PNY5_MIZYE|nr:uncharacterized protein LOC110466596 [Mizuhopecten yessoensis]OWF38164.1 hypothetical protein KP79_PYT08810 [Mizuhopecten yessoensis]